MDIWLTWINIQRDICCQFSLLIWISFIGQFTHSINQFTEFLQKKLDTKRASTSDIDNLENIVVE